MSLDVGGGAVENDEKYNLASISLRWMVRQCYIAKTGIKFQGEKLKELGLDPELLKKGDFQRLPQEVLTHESVRAAMSGTSHSSTCSKTAENQRDLLDVLTPVHDSLDGPSA